jgi:hypothetical protein
MTFATHSCQVRPILPVEMLEHLYTKYLPDEYYVSSYESRPGAQVVTAMYAMMRKGAYIMKMNAHHDLSLHGRLSRLHTPSLCQLVSITYNYFAPSCFSLHDVYDNALHDILMKELKKTTFAFYIHLVAAKRLVGESDAMWFTSREGWAGNSFDLMATAQKNITHNDIEVWYRWAIEQIDAIHKAVDEKIHE